MSVPSFRTEDDEAAYWLALLRDGDEAAKIAARDGLARIFALRGRWSEVAELCALQIEHGVCTPQMYERLAAANFKAGNTDTMQSTHADANGKHRRLRSHGAAPEPPAPSANVAHLTVGNYEPTGPALPRHSGPDRSLSA